MEKQKGTLTDRIGLWAYWLLCALFAVQTVQYIVLGALEPFVTLLVIEALVLLLGYAAWRGRMPFLMLLGAVLCFVLYFNMVSAAYANLGNCNMLFLPEAIVCALWAVGGTALLLWKKEKSNKLPLLPLGAMAVILITFLLTWGLHTRTDKAWTGHAKRQLWAVPTTFDATEAAHKGTLEELVYDTKAYATDSRAVQKRALVYLPYGYDAEKPYNILYLMHGTGDDENYWLQTHGYNKVMLDRLIETGEIEPLIVVTPTFYTEGDCTESLGNLDALTFSFRDELRNDLMPAVESKYSTYAKTVDEAGFADSRDHRAFAGLSRGAVTTCHSAFCGSLDYFSYFGMFSAFRTTADYFQKTIQSDAWKDLPIHYFYMTTGNFDFGMPAQVAGYRMLTDLEPRLVYGVNTSFDMFPMRYHSIGDWHLALYNYLQKIF
ncbi:MAG: hypothetical protein IJ138_10410 [Clostridia bacterium]|nr:hypothetical protein [Clostridia bacterium]